MRAIGVDTRTCDLEVGTYPVETHAADAIVFTEVIEHLYVDPLVALSEANRILRLGGICLLSTPNLLSLRNRVNLLRGRMDRVIEHPLLAFLQKHQIGHAGHVRLYAPQELVEMLGIFGFRSSVTFRGFDFWESVPDGATDAGDTAVTRGGERDAPPPRRRRFVRPPMDYVHAAIATGRVYVERVVPQFRAHMFVIARKTEDVRLEQLNLSEVRRRLDR